MNEPRLSKKHDNDVMLGGDRAIPRKCNVCEDTLFRDILGVYICLTCLENLQTLQRWINEGCCIQYNNSAILSPGGVFMKDGVLNVVAAHYLPDETNPRPTVVGWFDDDAHGVTREFPDWDVSLQMVSPTELSAYCHHCHEWFYMPIFAKPPQGMSG